MARRQRDYLRKLRIDLATVLLIATARSLAEIGAAVGYTSELAFSRAFQGRRACPRPYRQVRRAGTSRIPAAGV